jgi:hypothetical protein
MITIQSIEEEIFRLEEIRIVVRAPRITKVEKDYDYTRKAHSNMTVKDWINTRVKPIIGDLEIEVINGNGQTMIHPLTNLETIRSSYNLNY